MKNQRSTQTRFGLRTVAALMLMLVVLACTLAVSAFAATSIQLTTADLTYRNVNGTYTATVGTAADVTADFAVKAGWKLASNPDAKVTVEVEKATLASTDRGDTTVTVQFKLSGDDAANYTVEDLVIPAKISAANDIPQIGVGNLGSNYYKDGVYTTEYNGADKVDVYANITLNTAGLTFPAGVGVEIASAELNNATVAGAKYVKVTFKLVDLNPNDDVDATVGYNAPNPVIIPAKVTPKALTWTNATVSTDVALEYGETAYDVDVKELLRTLNGLNGFVGDDTASVVSAQTVITGVNKAGTVTTTVAVSIDNTNYTAPAVTVNVNVTPIKLKVDWSTVEDAYIYGNKAVFGIESVRAYFVDSNGNPANPTFYLPVTIWNADGSQQITNFVGNAGNYQFRVVTPDADVYVIEGDDAFESFEIIPATYDVTMNDVTYIGNADNTSGVNETVYQLLVSGDLPQEIRDQIKYYVNGEAFNGTSVYGVYTVTAILPSSPNYNFTKNNQPLTSLELTAEMCINRKYIATGSEADKYQVIVVGKYGFSSLIKVEVNTPTFDRTVLRGYPIHSEFTLTMTGVTGEEEFIVYIPLSETLYMRHVDEPSIEDLYVYEPATNEIVKASERYDVTMDNGYYVIEGYTGSQPISFVIAPTYHTPFFLSAPGIALLVLIVLLILALMFLLGIKLLRIKANLKDNARIVIDTVGEPYVGEEIVVEGGDGPPTIDVDALTAELEETVEPANEEDEAEIAARTREAVDESMKQLLDEASQIELPYEDTTAADEATEALADKIAENLANEVAADNGDANEVDPDAVDVLVTEAMEEVTEDPAEETVEEVVAEEVAPEPVEEVVEEPVAETVEEALDEEPEIVEAMAVVEEEPKSEEDEDDNDDDNDDDDDDSFGGFGMAGLKFIDIEADPEGYNALLEQERQGLIQIVYRYRKSYTSRMIQSQGNVQDYYSAIKNLFLSYKGIKDRTSWNYETFNRGRIHAAKVNAKTKTLYLYLALNPEELVDTKYNFVDVSSKKKYATVPVLLKIKGDRKFKHALELIEKLCGEQLELKKIEGREDVDYRVEYKTTEELVADGVVKKLAAGIPVAAPVEETPVEEAPAEETVAEEAPVEEAPAEEAVAVDAPVDETTTEN